MLPRWTDLELKAAVKLLVRSLLEELEALSLRLQGDGHDQSLIGLQETGAELSLRACWEDGRDGHHVSPTRTHTYIHTYTHCR